MSQDLQAWRANHVLNTPLLVSTENVLFQPRYWPAQDSTYYTHEGSKELPQHNADSTESKPGQNEFDELARLVQVVLALNIVLRPSIRMLRMLVLV